MKKTYADECLGQANYEGFDCFLAEKVPELAKRLNLATKYLREVASLCEDYELYEIADATNNRADSLEESKE